MAPDAALVARFAADLDALVAPGERLGLAVSGGPDSMALLLLAAAARPGLIEAATVDHGLRKYSAAEAVAVERLCESLRVPHRIMTVAWTDRPTSAVQEKARDARYALLAGRLRERSLAALATGHHRDDQAETLLMRLARGSGIRGLAAMRPEAPLPGAPDLRLVRPLLGWSHSEIIAVCSAAGIEPVDDPSNADRRFERVRLRQWLAGSGLDADAFARSAAHLRGADEAVDWAVGRHWQESVERSADGFAYVPADAPGEIRRRIVARILAELATEGGGEPLRGRELDRLLAELGTGRTATLRGVECRGGERWLFRAAPPRRNGLAFTRS